MNRMHRGLALLCLALAASCNPQSTSPTNALSATERSEALAELDRVPEGYVERFEQFRAAAAARAQALGPPSPEFVFLYYTQWEQPVVTVAFRGGGDIMRRRIEAAAQEWTSHSNGHFAFNFRNADDSFREWTGNESAPAAEIRISFETQGPLRGYWSEIGLVAATVAADKPTMNLAGIGAFSGDDETWRTSPEHHTVLHEFGHALGLEHEHYHTQCQAGLKLEPDLGYVPTPSESRRYNIPDDAGRSPGAVLYHQGPEGWDPHHARLAVDAHYFFANEPGGQHHDQSDEIDQQSVMLYYFPDYLLLPNSRCADQGFSAYELSPGDVAYFQGFYDRQLPPRR